ncbi:hypothetical protein A2818_00875 [Candidatus Nomurabacteria bacterium RIFCSPHIGHO2_01_FULL_40_12]|uniref:EfeO-type cupredoxin-like domain-containing protein n=1 Tax=Candidatus Nomurabacteria bacterium RIFCSPHIGHO2_01_FULL_40_12 TaxID=1801737 RepID=A0A1F6V069_9BACT|nr:MAG: hypothetical protein A2818_00875 [Candidatus Nomurabacteria bacterium RIFCSPHIGHO2_01_FULL_40_12]
MSNTKLFFVIILALAVIVFVFISLGSLKPPAPESLQSSNYADEQKLMQDIGPNATPEKQQEYFLLAKRLAKEGDSITIKDCKGSPTVLKATPGKMVTVTNQDGEDHQVILESGKYKYAVAANSTAEVKFDLFRGKGFYSYGCDRVAGPAGILFVEE